MDGLLPIASSPVPSVRQIFIEHIRQWLIEIRKRSASIRRQNPDITKREPAQFLQIEWPTVLQKKAAEWQERARVINQTTNNVQQQSTAPNFLVIPQR